jgi:hypothetical protein
MPSVQVWACFSPFKLRSRIDLHVARSARWLAAFVGLDALNRPDDRPGVPACRFAGLLIVRIALRLRIEANASSLVTQMASAVLIWSGKPSYGPCERGL